MYQKPAMLTIVPKSNLVFVENNDEDYQFLMREVRPMGTLNLPV